MSGTNILLLMDIGGLLFPVLILLVFYFFFIRPQNKKQKEQQTFVESLQKGQEVVTASGLIGRINKIDDNGIINLQVDTKTYIRVLRSAISREMTEAAAKPNNEEKT